MLSSKFHYTPTEKPQLISLKFLEIVAVTTAIVGNIIAGGVTQNPNFHYPNNSFDASIPVYPVSVASRFGSMDFVRARQQVHAIGYRYATNHAESYSISE
jgi:hypothetical protein